MRALSLALLLMPPALISPASGQSLVAEKPEFNQLVPADAVVEKLAGGFKFVEGPAWNPVGGYLIFSDIPGDKLYRYDPAAKAAVAFREPSHNANGNFYDPDGNLFTCEHGSRSVTKESTREQARVRTLIADFEGKRLNSPNDVTVKSDGTVWFTDPTYGLGKGLKEQTTNNVYRYSPTLSTNANTLGIEPVALATDFVQPNGLCFSPDEKLLYVADSDKPRHIRVFDVTADNHLANSRVFCHIDKGVPDGIRCDRHGNVFSSSDEGIQIFAPDGTRLGKILVPEPPANLCFGGAEGNELFITARTSLYRIRLTTTAPGKPDAMGK